jgi:hypothetical protein
VAFLTIVLVMFLPSGGALLEDIDPPEVVFFEPGCQHGLHQDRLGSRVYLRGLSPITITCLRLTEAPQLDGRSNRQYNPQA